MVELSQRVQQVTPSATLASAQRARQLRALGHDIISLTVGEPDFPTPQYIKDAAIQAITTNASDSYTAATGIPQLKQAIIQAHQRLDSETYKENQVIVGSGAKHILYVLFQAILNAGDEVLLPVPYWVSYSEQIKLAEGVPVFVQTTMAKRFKVTVQDLEKHRTERTKVVIINSPNNPSGMVYTTEELREIGEWAVRHRLLIISDEIYYRLVYNGVDTVSLASLSPDIKAQTIIINGVSKTYAMTGWRIGYALSAREDIIAAMSKIVTHETSNPTAVSQYAALAAYNGPQKSVDRMRLTFEHRLNMFFELIVSIPGFKAIKPQGAFYLFPNVKEAATMTGYDTVDDFCDALLEQAHVAVVPGRAFGMPDHIRMSYAGDDTLLHTAVERIQHFIETNVVKG